MYNMRIPLLLQSDLFVRVSLSVCMSDGHNVELCKNGQTDRDAV